MPLPLPKKKLPTPMPAPVRRAAPLPAPAKVVPLPAPVRKLPPVRTPAFEGTTVVTSFAMDRHLKRPPMATRKFEATVYEPVGISPAMMTKALARMATLITDIQSVEWTLMDGKQTKQSFSDSLGMCYVGYWFSVFVDSTDNKPMITLSHIARRYSHSEDKIGILCERRICQPL